MQNSSGDSASPWYATIDIDLGTTSHWALVLCDASLCHMPFQYSSSSSILVGLTSCYFLGTESTPLLVQWRPSCLSSYPLSFSCALMFLSLAMVALRILSENPHWVDVILSVVY